MWVFHLAVVAAAIYAAVISGMYFAQTWLLFPTALVSGQVRLPASAQRLEVEAPSGDRPVGVHIPASSGREQNRPLLLAFGGYAWNADATALYPHGFCRIATSLPSITEATDRVPGDLAQRYC